jgi:hypothetical protein
MYQKVANNTMSWVPINHLPRRWRIYDCLHGERIETFEPVGEEREGEATGFDWKRKTRNSKPCNESVVQNNCLGASRENAGRAGKLHATELVTARCFLIPDHRSVSPRLRRVLSSLAFDEFRARVPAAHSVAPETRSFRAKPSCDHCLDRSPRVSFQSRCMAEQSLCHVRCCEFSTSLSKVNGDDWTKTVSRRRILNVLCQG